MRLPRRGSKQQKQEKKKINKMHCLFIIVLTIAIVFDILLSCLIVYYDSIHYSTKIGLIEYIVMVISTLIVAIPTFYFLERIQRKPADYRELE